ncbi:bifunctional DNA primase/polymerase [Kribbella sp. NBC_00889]|uniref:bifunctional DNA primase/polymerase n=1 Tax=Kribbella sp. NBC_00889 TaxID=2975974 RepID=UPI00386B60AE|nr:bifunctional DNA primase/polymerase [Kribbella sp. NBC_00889]
MTLTMTDLFCGARGSSPGAVQVPGVAVKRAANHWKLAVETHYSNHPTTDHDHTDRSASQQVRSEPVHPHRNEVETVSTTQPQRVVTDPAHQALSRAAHWHADHGFAVFPLAPGRKTPGVTDWKAAATTDHLAIARIWRKAPYNIGVAAGPSGLLVVDLDQPKNPSDQAPEPWRARGATSGADVLALVAADHGASPQPTYTVATPSGGQHLYYRQPARGQLGNSAGRIGWKIDTRGRGGYVVGAGSITTDGRYLATGPSAPQPLPSWLIDALDPPAPVAQALQRPASSSNSDAYTLAALTGELEKVLAAAPGQRNDTLNRAAFALGQLVGAQLLDQRIARDELTSAAGWIGLPRSEAQRTITSGITAGIRCPRQHSA